MFKLDAVLESDTLYMTSLPLCELLLMNDSNYPWFILVPRVAGITELIDLNEQQQAQFWSESNQLAKFLISDFSAEKLNIAALGNVVAQLHIHHIARFKSDASWPKPVWGQVVATPYEQNEITSIKSRVLKQF